MKIKIKHIILAIIILFGIFAMTSSVSACMQVIPKIDLDEGQNTFKIKDNKYHVSWFAYRHSTGKNDNIMGYKEYELRNKKGKTISTASVSFDIKKIKKNRIKVTTTYSMEPQIDKVKIYKTKLSVRAFYWKHIETQFRKKIDKKAFFTEIVIDKGKLVAILPYNDTNISTNPNNISSVKHHINWTSKRYTKFPNIIHVSQDYGNNAPATATIMPYPPGQGYVAKGSTEYHFPSITLKKIDKNRIQIKIGSLRKLNGDIINHKTYYVKTKLSLNSYYKNVFKLEMIEMFTFS